MIVRNQLRNFAPLANNDLGVKRKFARNFSTRLRQGHRAPDHERARSANVNGTEVLQLLGQLGRSEGPVAPDIDPSEKDNHCHSLRLAEMAREVKSLRKRQNVELTADGHESPRRW